MKLDELHKIGARHGTDKSDGNHTHCGESYLHIYEKYLNEYREKKINFLELGVKGGQSLRMWKEYFANGNIYGVDFNPDCKKHQQDRIEVQICGQDDEKLVELSKEIGGFDIILDDASHINSLCVSSFDLLFPILKKGGLYIMEDLGNSYLDLSNSNIYWDGELRKNASNGVNLNHDRRDLDKLFLNLIKRMDQGDQEINAVHFWSKICIIKKGE